MATEENNETTNVNPKQMVKELRKQAPRSSHGEWAPAADRPDMLSLLQEQDKGRIERLLPIKYGRMLESPFAFLRGSAVVMAADLALPVTDDYPVGEKNALQGIINWVRIDLEEDDHSHMIPEDQLYKAIISRQ